MMIFLSEIISVFIPILKIGHFLCLFTRYVSVKAINMRVNPGNLHTSVTMHRMCITQKCIYTFVQIKYLHYTAPFPMYNRDPKECHQNLYYLS